jgi:hypothetical protein
MHHRNNGHCRTVSHLEVRSLRLLDSLIVLVTGSHLCSHRPVRSAIYTSLRCRGVAEVGFLQSQHKAHLARERVVDPGETLGEDLQVILDPAGGEFWCQRFAGCGCIDGALPLALRPFTLPDVSSLNPNTACCATHAVAALPGRCAVPFQPARTLAKRKAATCIRAQRSLVLIILLASNFPVD